jgi:TolB-like protein/class 3 adenylate cyclase/Tfp pilus assembly protein PilF
VSETRKLAAILVADIAGFSQLIGADEEETLARLRALRSGLIDPMIALHSGRLVKRTGDGAVVEFRSVVEAVRSAIDVQNGLAARNADLPPEKRIVVRVGIHVGDVVEEADGDLMGDGVNIAARLEGLAEPGGICLSGAAYEQVRDRLKDTFVDLGEKTLKNITRPVRVYAVKVGSGGPATAPLVPKPEWREPPHLSILVLPFTNIGGDPEQEYFADGITENLTTELSRISGAFIIAHGTARAYKGKAADLTRIGRDLNVRYVLEGSVQRGKARMRVNVQLIEAQTGAQLWGERFDKPVADLFDMQDEIVGQLANQLRAELSLAEARRAERTPHPDSMDLYFRGRALYYQSFAPESLAKAREFYQRALELDSQNIDALVGAATVDVIIGASYMTDDPRTVLTEAEASLTKALAAAPNHASAHHEMGVLLRATNRPQRAIEEQERALAIDPNMAVARAQMGVIQIVIGRAEETEAYVLEAIRLSPHDAMMFLFLYYVGVAKAYLGEYAQAVPWLRKSIDANRNFPITFFYLAACLAQLGRLDEARREVKSGLLVDPKFTLARFHVGAQSDNAIYLAQRARLEEGMRRAGAPEE